MFAPAVVVVVVVDDVVVALMVQYEQLQMLAVTLWKIVQMSCTTYSLTAVQMPPLSASHLLYSTRDDR